MSFNDDLLKRLEEGDNLSQQDLQHALVLGHLAQAKSMGTLVNWVRGALAVVIFWVILICAQKIEERERLQVAALVDPKIAKLAEETLTAPNATLEDRKAAVILLRRAGRLKY